ncbi:MULTISPECIES: manganese/iron ABC transporter ATP-binding protein [unclassified Gilliamella]|uniref:manganese/iron ABC transporter ATP-binding protein n=1 Tax=unclassified Gilliamella TaxID=2685620 RepID=UPI0009BFF6CC|nr:MULTISPECIES: manganese/iron ABC transporter ATP-binding protein [Gilliamella]MCX8580959.1 manganese/iron ABC transporter ATP-binding protein [Gilliamella sp. B3482]MCX8583649.1 manganese/iron ABC transporter ATP-binding protein [Gilliamella sp. B3372]MCX8586648.1 manganese/iron ABC transporter ATP-binding protein [Gilliamella sp. B3562]MCX8594781.1 manganese/iron ABC transporter ATP-binding protein [Gilliamella sp. B3367]MCX8597158.1 manganese/iron ABC transporter ATP-binding protein [Gill
MTQICLNVDDITVTYNNGHTAIHDASFRLNGGTICALVGVNGSGKSTLFKSIMGMIKPTKGQVTFNDISVKQALKQNIIAYVPQTEEVDWDFPVLVSDVVMMGRYGHMSFLRIPSKEDKRQVDLALERVNMLDFKHRQIGQLSGGQKKRVFLARALAQQGKVLLLDEPFTGVDVKTENAIIDLLKDLRDEGHLILVSTHNLGSVPEFCDQVVLINQTVLAFGETKTTFTPQNLMMTFGGALRYLSLSGEQLHQDEDPRKMSILTDDERAAIFYGEGNDDSAHKDFLVEPTVIETKGQH